MVPLLELARPWSILGLSDHGFALQYSMCQLRTIFYVSDFFYERDVGGEGAFDILRIKYATTTSMHGIFWDIPCHFYSDASKYGACLWITRIRDGVKLPILYDLFSLSSTECKYPTYKRGLLEIVKFAKKKKYDHLLQNPQSPGVFHTDYKPLVRFLSSDNP